LSSPLAQIVHYVYGKKFCVKLNFELVSERISHFMRRVSERTKNTFLLNPDKGDKYLKEIIFCQKYTENKFYHTTQSEISRNLLRGDSTEAKGFCGSEKNMGGDWIISPRRFLPTDVFLLSESRQCLITGSETAILALIKGQYLV
jgi:hypothetical protein